jgi:hypothetical protein
MKNTKKLMSMFLSLAMLLSIITAMPFSVSANSNGATFEYDGYTVDYVINSTYGINQSINVTVTNTGTETIENWMLAYDDFNGNITGIWNASVAESDSGTEYIRNVGHNANITPNASINFGYTLTDFTGVPGSIVMCQERVEKQTGFSATLNVVNDWGSAFNGEIVLTNETDNPIEWWELTFDSNFTITQVTTSWAAAMTDNGDCNYTFKGTYTGIVAPNSEVRLGFQATKNGDPMIENASLTEVVVGYLSEITAYLIASETEFLAANETETVYFYADIEGANSTATVNLVDSNDNVVAEMKDDGQYNTSGDDIQNDEVFTAKLNIDLSAAGTLSYNAIVQIGGKNVESDEVTIYIVAPLTPQDFEDMATVNAACNALRASIEYTEMNVEERAEAFFTELSALVASGLIVENSIIYNESSFIISFKHSSGLITGIKLWEPDENTNGGGFTDRERSAYNSNVNINRTDSILNATANSAIIDKTPSALILWSFNMPWDSASYRVPFYENLETDWENAGLNTTRVMGTTVNDFKKMSGYNAVVVAGHGDTFDNQPSWITSEKLDNINMASYYIDIALGRIGSYDYDSANSYYVIFPKAITAWYNSTELNGSIFFSEACTFMGAYNANSGILNETFPNALLSRGTEAVMGFYNSVKADYSRNFMNTVVTEMITGVTARAAFNTAVNTHGANDAQPAPATAVPHFRGDNNATLITGIRNGSFEQGSLLNPMPYWTTVGDIRRITELGDSEELTPRDGNRMALLSTGIGSLKNTAADFYDGTQGSLIQQTFRVPDNVSTLSFDYNFISEEPSFLPGYTNYIGSQYNDEFAAEIVVNGNVERIIHESVNSSTWLTDPFESFKLTIGQSGGRPAYQIGWNSANFDLTPYRGQIVTLRFMVFDRGDQVYDTVALADNITVN